MSGNHFSTDHRLPPTTPSRPLTGVAVFLLSPASTNTPPKFLLGERLGSHGANTYALPGGHLEHSESFEDCSARELLEETGLTVSPSTLKFLTATNDVMEEGKHYVTIFMVGRMSDEDVRVGREAVVMEPGKCRAWEWVSWQELVEMYEAETRAEDKGKVKRLFQPMRHLLEQRPGVVPGLD